MKNKLLITILFAILFLLIIKIASYFNQDANTLLLLITIIIVAISLSKLYWLNYKITDLKQTIEDNYELNKKMMQIHNNHIVEMNNINSKHTHSLLKIIILNK